MDGKAAVHGLIDAMTAIPEELLLRLHLQPQPVLQLLVQRLNILVENANTVRVRYVAMTVVRGQELMLEL